MTAYMISILIGVLAVLQAGFNRQVMARCGLPTAILINSSVFFVTVLALYLVSLGFKNQLPEGWAPPAKGIQLEWWFLLPGLCGLAVVGGLPWVIPQIGALRAFMFFIVAQMVASFVWDLVAEKTPFQVLRLVGLAFAVIGVVLANWRTDGP